MSLTLGRQLVLAAILLTTATGAWGELTVEGFSSTRCPEALSVLSADYRQLTSGQQGALESVYPRHENRQRDCWYFPHGEHGGGAFVPYEWGVEGEPEASIADEIVEAALNALPRVLDAYAEANGRLTNPVFLAFLNEGYNSRSAAYDVFFAPEAQANMGTGVANGPLGDRACLIVIRHPDNWRAGVRAGAETVDTLEFGLAHELAHCYFAKKLYPRIPARSWAADSFHKWWEEGAAHYMAGHVFPNREILTDQARRYEFDKDVIDNAYGNFWLIGAFDYEREYWWSDTLSQIEATTSPRFRNLWRFLERAATSFDKRSAYRVIDEFPRQKFRLYRTLAMYRNGATSMGRVCSGGG